MKGVGRLRKAYWWVLDYGYAAAWQVRSLLPGPKPEQFLDGDQAPVIVLPGVYESWKFMLPLVRELHANGHPVHIVPGLGRNRVPVMEGASMLASYLQRENLTDVALVAHSKGGLIAKHLLVFGDAAARVRIVVTISTPFAGSRYATYLLNRTLRALAPTNETMVSLARAVDANAKIVSIFPSFDPHIPEGSFLAGAKNVELPTGGHFRVLGDPAARAEVLESTS
ncbi:esterase/lipase family protein [Leucobacter sp. NPDC015123]|uniref:esterase/lipase family protein n=1 Tax=Leucobacter sp. NPDC015123 TaxID=3364129 RepID=UPI0036F49721